MLMGCGRETVSDRDVTDAVNPSTPSGLSPIVSEYDFGPILSSGQVLSHEFLLRNPTNRPIRLANPELLTPCCSAVEFAPDLIPPHGSVPLRIVFKPGYQSGLKRVGFIIPTDSSTIPRFDLRVSATLFGEVEIQLIEGLKAPLVSGQNGTMLIGSQAAQSERLDDRLPLGLPRASRSTPTLSV